MFENTQPPEPKHKGDGTTLDFHSMFFTIQGEGPFSGHRSIFIRLAGCNLQCPGCDTEYTRGRERRTVAHIVNDAVALARENAGVKKPLIVITGGEPLRQNLDLLISMLVRSGFRIQIESNGVFPVSEFLQQITKSNTVDIIVSPKTSRVHPKTAEVAMAFKYVMNADSVNPDDGLPIEALHHRAATGVARPPQGKPVFLSPFDEQDEARNKLHRNAIRDSALKFGYVAGLQVHKILGVE